MTSKYLEWEKVCEEIHKQKNFYCMDREGETDLEKLYLLYGADNALTVIEDILSDLPAADVMVASHGTPLRKIRPSKHERFEEVKTENGEILYKKHVYIDETNWAEYCPACRKRLCSRFKSYCPNCGIKLKGK